MVWKGKFENYIFKWCYKLSRLSDPPLTPFKYWLQGGPFQHWPLGALWSTVTSQNITIPASRQLHRSGSEFVKDVNVQPWWLLPRQPSLTNSQQPQHRVLIKHLLSKRHNTVSPGSKFYCDSRWGRVIYCFHKLKMSSFPLSLWNDGFVLFNFRGIE